MFISIEVNLDLCKIDIENNDRDISVAVILLKVNPVWFKVCGVCVAMFYDTSCDVELWLLHN